jgi:hypothetical protein
MTPTNEVRGRLNELGIEWKSEIDCDTYWYGQDRTFYKFTEYRDGTTSFSTCQWNLTPKQVLTAPIAATVGRSCASCPEMDNPDSYINHLQSALKWHDEHVPRPTNPRNTCVVLQGEKPPEEVMFVREGGGVTHYQPERAVSNRTSLARQLREVHGLDAFVELFGYSWEDNSIWTWHDVACAMADAVDAMTVGAGTCRNIAELNREGVSGYFFVCSECGLAVHADRGINKTNYTCRKPDGSIDLHTFNSGGEYKFERCPRCGRKVTE